MVLDLVRTLSVVANQHVVKRRPEKAAIAVRKASMFLDLLPVNEYDLGRINADLQLTIVSSLLFKDRPKEQAAKLHNNSQEYQTPGVDNYLLVVVNFLLTLAYLKDGDFVQFYNCCEALKDVIVRVLASKLSIPTEHLRTSYVICLKMTSLQHYSREVFGGMICLGILLKWMNKRLTDLNDAETVILLANAKALAQDHSLGMAAKVQKIASCVDEHISHLDSKKELMKSAKALKDKSPSKIRKSFSINVMDYDKTKSASLPTTRPTSANRRMNGVDEKSEYVNGSTARASCYLASHLMVGGTFIEEPTAAQTFKSKPDQEATTGRFTEWPAALQDKRRSLFRALLSLFTKDSPVPGVYSETNRKREEEEAANAFDAQYKKYLSFKRNKSKMSFDLSSKVKIPKQLVNTKRYEDIRFVSAGKKTEPKKTEGTREFLTYGAPYRGIRMINPDRNLELPREHSEANIQEDIVIVSKRTDYNPIGGLDRSETKLDSIQRTEKVQRFGLRNLLKSSNSQANQTNDKVDDWGMSSGGGPVMEVPRGELLLLCRPNVSDLNKSAKLGSWKPKYNLKKTKGTPLVSQAERQNSKSNRPATARVSAEKNAPKPEKEPDQKEKPVPDKGKSFVERMGKQRMSVVSAVYKVYLSDKSGKREQKSLIGPKLTDLKNEEKIVRPTSEQKKPSEKDKEENAKLERTVRVERRSSKLKNSKESNRQILARRSSRTDGRSFVDQIDDNLDLRPLASNKQSSSKLDRESRNSMVMGQEEQKSRAYKMSRENLRRSSSKIFAQQDHAADFTLKQKVSAVAHSSNQLIVSYKDVNLRRTSRANQLSRQSSVLMKQNLLQAEEDLASSDERTPRSKLSTLQDARVSRRSLLSGLQFKPADVLEKINELDGAANLEKSQSVSPGKEKDHQDSSFPKARCLPQDASIAAKDKKNHLKTKSVVKQELLGFVHSFNALNNFFKRRHGDSSRTAFLLIWFLPDSISIRKPRDGLDDHKSMLESPDDYQSYWKKEGFFKPW